MPMRARGSKAFAMQEDVPEVGKVLSIDERRFWSLRQGVLGALQYPGATRYSGGLLDARKPGRPVTSEAI